MINITAQYFKLLNNADCLGIVLKGCAIYCVNQKPFETRCAIAIVSSMGSIEQH
jgi:hypothetical protein